MTDLKFKVSGSSALIAVQFPEKDWRMAFHFK
jgi:hypothetical protein